MADCKLFLIIHDVRSAHNVGSLLRTADGLGVEAVYLTGYTPYPKMAGDMRLPHISDKLDRQINKTALGAAESIRWSYQVDVFQVISKLKKEGITVAALEQSAGSRLLKDYKPTGDIALIVGNEVEGLGPKILKSADISLEIPMSGQKESFNVAVAAAIGLYHLKHVV